MTLVLDAGAFVAVERGDDRLLFMLEDERRAGQTLLTHGGVIGQVWRSGRGRQARLARLLADVDVVPLDEVLGRRAGVLLGRARTSDVIDAAVVLLADDRDQILTSDPKDLVMLAHVAGLRVDFVAV